MVKKLIVLLIIILLMHQIKAQVSDNYELGIGARFQKTEQLYCENGVGADFTSDFLLKKKIHLKMSYATSRLGSAFSSNAIKQDNYLIGADWRFRTNKCLQVFVGLNTGYFHADMEEPMFNMLPHNSLLMSAETGLVYKFKFPMSVSLSAGYNLITTPGSLFPVFYQMSMFYTLGKK